MNTSQTMPKKHNPLSQWFRQPKIYIQLPSHGKFYPAGSLDVSVNDEYAVYAMTAKDELMLKTPDALMSGQSTVEVIKSCVPSIINPWEMPSVDVDAVLLSIRVATYGENMEVTANCPSCKEENTYNINLLDWLSKLRNFNFLDVIDAPPLTIHIKPYSYKELSDTGLKTFEQQRLLAIINNDDISDSEKIEKFNESFVKLTELTVNTLAKSVWKIDTPTEEITDIGFITEFVQNAPKEIFGKISTQLSNIKDQMSYGTQHVSCEHCNHEFDMPIELDQSSFFVSGS